MTDSLTFTFTVDQWKLIADSLYFANNRLGKAKLAGGKFEDHAAAIQRIVNGKLKEVTKSATCTYTIYRDDITGNFFPVVMDCAGLILYRGEDGAPVWFASEILAAEAARRWARQNNRDLRVNL